MYLRLVLAGWFYQTNPITRDTLTRWSEVQACRLHQRYGAALNRYTQASLVIHATD